MDPQDEIEPGQMDVLTSAFRDQLLACLEECAHGRRGLFSEHEHLGGVCGARYVQSWRPRLGVR